MKKWLKSFVANQHTKNTVVLAILQVLSQAFSLISLLTLTRIYNPRDFGLYALIQTTALVLSVFCTFRLETLILSRGSVIASTWLTIAITHVTASITIVSITVLFIISLLSESGSENTLFLGMIISNLLGPALVSTFRNYLQRIDQLITTASILVGKPIINVFVATLLYYQDYSPFTGGNALATANAISDIATIALLLLSAPTRFLKMLSVNTWRKLLQIYAPEKSFLFGIFLSGLLSYLCLMTPPWIISNRYDLETAGLYATALTISFGVLAIFENSAVIVLQRFVSNRIQNRISTTRIYFRIVGAISTLLICVLLVVAVSAWLAIKEFQLSHWESLPLVIMLLIPRNFSSLIFSCAQFIQLVFLKNSISVWVSIFRFFGIVASITLLKHFSWSSSYAIGAISLMETLAFAAQSIYSWHLLRRYEVTRYE